MNLPKVIKNDYGIRPRGKQDECFYCGQKVGKSHKEDCPVVTKEVLVKFSIEVPVRVPYSWEDYNIESSFNESSACADQSIETIWNFIKNLRKKGKCLCGHLRADYVADIDSTPKIPENEEKSDEA